MNQQKSDERMQVEITESEGALQKGEKVNLPTDVAEKLIADGKAKEVEEAGPESNKSLNNPSAENKGEVRAQPRSSPMPPEPKKK